MKTSIVLIFTAGIVLMFGPHALAQLAQTTPCPPGGGGSQSTPSGKTTQSKSTSTQNPSNKSAPAKNAPTQHQAGRRGYHGPSHGGAGGGVGVGVNVDLGGIGQRRVEPDPFAVPAGPAPHTEGKSSAVTTNTSEQTSRSRAGSHRQSSDDALWSQVNPLKKPSP